MGKVGTVICWKLDRISRSLRDGINLLVDWLDRDVRVIAVSQQFDFNGGVGKLIASVLLGIAEMERINIRENIIRGMKATKARGVKIGGKPVMIFALISDQRPIGLFSYCYLVFYPYLWT